MEGYVIVIDVDGTLLPSSNEINNDLINELKHFEEKNTIVLASGRGYHDLSLIHQKLNLKGPIISSNGASLDFFDGKTSVTMAIRNEIIKDIFSKIVILLNRLIFLTSKNYLFLINLKSLIFYIKLKLNPKLLKGRLMK